MYDITPFCSCSQCLFIGSGNDSIAQIACILRMRWGQRRGTFLPRRKDRIPHMIIFQKPAICSCWIHYNSGDGNWQKPGISGYELYIHTWENKKSIGYWKRFNLTLPGRSTLIKRLLISLVNHLGWFFMPKHNTMVAVQKSLDDFALGNLRVARNRIFLPPK